MTLLHPIRVERNPCNTHTEEANVSRIVGNRSDDGVKWTTVRVADYSILS